MRGLVCVLVVAMFLGGRTGRTLTIIALVLMVVWVVLVLGLAAWSFERREL